MAFRDTEDVYTDPTTWSREDAYMCMRWLSRVISKAPARPYYAQALASLDFSRMGDVPRAIARAAMEDVPACKALLSPEQASAIGSTRPLDPPLALTERPLTSGPWAWMGVLV